MKRKSMFIFPMTDASTGVNYKNDRGGEVSESYGEDKKMAGEVSESYGDTPHGRGGLGVLWLKLSQPNVRWRNVRLPL